MYPITCMDCGLVTLRNFGSWATTATSSIRRTAVSTGNSKKVEQKRNSFPFTGVTRSCGL